MKLRYRILADAKQELDDAVTYHEAQRAGLWIKLFEEFDAVIEHARAFPTAGRPVKLDTRLAVRCFQMRRFRYAIFTTVIDDTLVVFSVSHHKREPGYWAERLGKLER